MSTIFYKICDGDDVLIGSTTKPDIDIKTIYFELTTSIRKRICDGDAKIVYLETIEGTPSEIRKLKAKLEFDNNPLAKRKVYNKTYYDKSKKLYLCECGSKIVDRKQIIDRHNKTKKHLSFVQS